MQYGRKYRFRISILTMLLAMIAAACSAPVSQADTAQTNTQAETVVMMEENLDDEIMATAEPDMAVDSAEHPESQAMEMGIGDTMNDSDEGEMMEDAESTAMMDEGTTDIPMLDTPGWYSAALIDVNREADFTISDYHGKVVLVETMAIWCSNCLSQQKQVRELHNLLGEHDDFISIGLDIDPNENADDLAAYTDRNGFDWVYAVAPPEVSREIGQTYGSQFLNPPSTPILIIDRQGEAHPLPFGIMSAADLQAAVEPFLNEGM